MGVELEGSLYEGYVGGSLRFYTRYIKNFCNIFWPCKASGRGGSLLATCWSLLKSADPNAPGGLWSFLLGRGWHPCDSSRPGRCITKHWCYLRIPTIRDCLEAHAT